MPTNRVTDNPKCHHDQGDVAKTHQIVDRVTSSDASVKARHIIQSFESHQDVLLSKESGQTEDANPSTADLEVHQHRPGATTADASNLISAAHRLAYTSQPNAENGQARHSQTKQTQPEAKPNDSGEQRRVRKSRAPQPGSTLMQISIHEGRKSMSQKLSWAHSIHAGLLCLSNLNPSKRRKRQVRYSRDLRKPQSRTSLLDPGAGSQQYHLEHLCTGLRMASRRLREFYSPSMLKHYNSSQVRTERRLYRRGLSSINLQRTKVKHIACLCSIWIALLTPMGAQVSPCQIMEAQSVIVLAPALKILAACSVKQSSSTEQRGHTTQQYTTHPSQCGAQTRHELQDILVPRLGQSGNRQKVRGSPEHVKQRLPHKKEQRTTNVDKTGSRTRPPTVPARKSQSQPGPKSGAGVLRLILMTSTLPGSCGVRVPGASTSPGRPNPQTQISQYLVGKQVEGASVQIASRAATRSHCAEAYKRAPDRVKTRRGGKQLRFRICTLNVGGLSAFMWADLKAFLSGPGLQYDAMLLQETHRTQSNEFRTAGWSAIGSASTSKADGLMTLINPKHATQNIKHEEVVPGRLQRVQVVGERGRVEILNAYQHVWSYNDSTEANIGRRQKLFDKIAQTVNSIACRHTVILAGDLNAELNKTHPYTGNALAHTKRHTGPGSAEPLALTRMIENAELIAEYLSCQPTANILWNARSQSN